MLVVQQLERIACALLRRLIDGGHVRSQAQRHIGVHLVRAVQEAQTLVASRSPIVEKALDQRRVFKHYIVHVSVQLPVERYRRRLALGTDAAWSRRMIRATAANATVQVFERDKLATVDS